MKVIGPKGVRTVAVTIEIRFPLGEYYSCGCRDTGESCGGFKNPLKDAPSILPRIMT